MLVAAIKPLGTVFKGVEGCSEKLWTPYTSRFALSLVRGIVSVAKVS